MLDIKICIDVKGGILMGGEKAEDIKTKSDYVNMLCTPENIEAAGGVENFQKIMKEWEKRDARLGAKNSVKCFVEYFGSKLLAVALIIGIIIVAIRVI